MHRLRRAAPSGHVNVPGAGSPAGVCLCAAIACGAFCLLSAERSLAATERTDSVCPAPQRPAARPSHSGNASVPASDKSAKRRPLASMGRQCPDAAVVIVVVSGSLPDDAKVSPGAIASSQARPKSPPDPPAQPSWNSVRVACGDWHGVDAALLQAAKADVWADQLGALVAGAQLERDWNLPEARKSYEEAMRSTDARVANCAERRYDFVAAEEAGFAWPFRWILPITWFKQNPRRAVLYSILTLVLGGAFLLVGLQRGRNGIYLSTPESLGGDVPVALFAAELRKAMMDVRALISAEAQSHQMNGSAALSLPSTELPDKLIASLPTVFGVDVGKIMPAILYAYHYFFVRLECGVVSSGTEIGCYSVLRRAWRTLGVWHIRVPIAASGNSPRIPIDEITLVARRVAYRAAARRADPLLPDV